MVESTAFLLHCREHMADAKPSAISAPAAGTPAAAATAGPLVVVRMLLPLPLCLHRVKHSLRKTSTARRATREAIAHQPQDAKLYMNRAAALLKLGPQYHAAALGRRIRCVPNPAHRGRFRRGIRMAMGELVEAWERFNLASVLRVLKKSCTTVQQHESGDGEARAGCGRSCFGAPAAKGTAPHGWLQEGYHKHLQDQKQEQIAASAYSTIAAKRLR